MLDGHTTHVVVRMIHVLAATVLVGGPVSITLLATSTRRDRLPPAAILGLATRIEVAYWLAFAIIVATGIGNLGALGSGLPNPDTDWGRTFVVKLLIVAALALFSAVRAIVIARHSLNPTPLAAASLSSWYGTTAAATTVVVALAIWLAHA
ncbi:MAG: hypothetical protein HOH95_15185 [Dehalococcoidia bacterium]|nr:hypothetical protein [Dehalococcoidia bacterium]